MGNNSSNKRRASMAHSQSSDSFSNANNNSINNLRPSTKKPLIEELPKRQPYQNYRDHNQNSHGSNSSRDLPQSLSKSYHSGMKDHNRGSSSSYNRSTSAQHE